MNLFQKKDTEFATKHIGSLNELDTNAMLQAIGFNSIEALIEKTIPNTIRLKKKLRLPAAISEYEYLQAIKTIADKNKCFKSYIGQGYYNTITPSVILRNVFENPGWYTQYTPYQAEISQGRLESLLNYQTMVCDITALPIANASLLDEATAAAEAMTMLFRFVNKEGISAPKFFIDENIFPQTKDVLITRATPLNIHLVHGNYATTELDNTFFGAVVQYPNSNGSVEDYRQFIAQVHSVGAHIVMATDLLALTLLTPPGELGADIAIGSAQRLGVPMGFGGPHAGFFAVKDDFKRHIPGRVIGASIDAKGNRALRMALQTREQHIKREKATSNICTAQALLANMAAMYAVYHGAEGLINIATRIALLAQTLSATLKKIGYVNVNKNYFDTLKVQVDSKKIKPIAEKNSINFKYFDTQYVGIALDETTTLQDVEAIAQVFATIARKKLQPTKISNTLTAIPVAIQRTSTFLTHQVFNIHRSETQMMRYLKYLENKDIALNTSMISLGSCTMKLNAATEMIPISWQKIGGIHPFAPTSQTKGYTQIIEELSYFLCEITGLTACSLQPNSGANGEYAGLLAIMNYHRAKKNAHRNVVLIPMSAHGTNPASAVMAGMQVVVIKTDINGYVDMDDLKLKAQEHKNNLGALMITYPSTHGVFEETIKEICAIIHQYGGQVYMDGANMNAQVGLTSPASIGADICHLNLHKTFAIPHGGGGPGVGPICAAKHLAPYLPTHIEWAMGKKNNTIEAHHAVSAAPFGSASVLPISYGYVKMLGAEGLTQATIHAILNANYMKARLEKYYKILFCASGGTCAHEFILDLRPFKVVGIEAEDIAKRLMDYGFHAPTLSFPVPGTIMIEPTESEDKAELDRFCDALINIYKEIQQIENGQLDAVDNMLKNAPHTQKEVCANEWTHPYSREVAAFPLPYLKENKFWATISRVNNTYGDRNLICTCPSVDDYV